jgi:hypothetical protein
VSRLPINRPVKVAQDLSKTAFEDEDINLFELFAAANGAAPGVIVDRTFTGCRIQGPAVMLVSAGVRFNDVNFGSPDGEMRNLVLRPAGERAYGTIPMRNCVFDGCEFYNVGFTGPEDILNQLLAVGR